MNELEPRIPLISGGNQKNSIKALDKFQSTKGGIGVLAVLAY